MKYFAYGSNMLLERLKARVSSAANPKSYALRKYRLRFHKESTDSSGKCNIVATQSEKDVVHGVLFDVRDEQIRILDKAEGVGNGYQRSEIKLMLEGAWAKVFLYVAEEGYIDDSLVPYSWYCDLVLAGAEQHLLPDDYIAGLQAVPFKQDSKLDRKSRLEALQVLKQYNDSKTKS